MSEQGLKEVDHNAEIDRHFALFQSKLSPRLAELIDWLQRPSSILNRIPSALLLVVGGIFSFLTVLGLWMLPLASCILRRM